MIITLLEVLKGKKFSMEDEVKTTVHAWSTKRFFPHEIKTLMSHWFTECGGALIGK